jgi:hypothetical protein
MKLVLNFKALYLLKLLWYNALQKEGYTLTNLEHENQLLRSVVADLSALIKDLLEVMPPEIREYDNVQRMIEIAEKLINYGSTLPTSDHRQ